MYKIELYLLWQTS